MPEAPEKKVVKIKNLPFKQRVLRIKNRLLNESLDSD